MYKINLLFIFKIYPVISVIYFFVKKEFTQHGASLQERLVNYYKSVGMLAQYLRYILFFFYYYYYFFYSLFIYSSSTHSRIHAFTFYVFTSLPLLIVYIQAQWEVDKLFWGQVGGAAITSRFVMKETRGCCNNGMSSTGINH